ncbi:hypothetical protein CPLU01_14829 [Colletotrichum plurivorum]|uniref:Uncharacterized protein n=1 Tax=Colletotrichum plurivorum TaxID=2175906 RepID=A0A8H6JGP4_9PEZI|nr:hypothetical protein CPLU01_14829 [Colletotrichum plurivorum]
MHQPQPDEESHLRTVSMKMEPHELKAAASQIEAEMSQDKDQIEQKFKRRLNQLIRDHESDCQGLIASFLTRASVKYPEDYETFKHLIRSYMPSYVSLIRYTRESCTVGFTAAAPNRTPSPGPEPVTTEQPTPSESPKRPPAARHKLPSRRMKSYSKRPTPEGVPKEATRRSLRKKRKTGSEEPFAKKTEPGIIIKSVASRHEKRRCWIFQYDLGEGRWPHMLHCPALKCKFVFSRDPIEDGLALRHFRECGVQNDGVEDILREDLKGFLSLAIGESADLEIPVVAVVARDLTRPTKKWISDHNREAERLSRQLCDSIPDADTATADSAPADPDDECKSEISTLTELSMETVNDSTTSSVNCGTENAVTAE